MIEQFRVEVEVTRNYYRQGVFTVTVAAVSANAAQ